MKTKILATAGLGICLLSPVFAQAGDLDGLYFRMTMSFGTFNQDHWWFLPDGRYMNNVPDDGLDPAVFEAGCQKMPAVCGTYKVQGDQIQLVPRKGRPSSMDFKQLPNDNIELEGRFTKHVDNFGSSAKLDGHYSWVGGASGGGTSVSASKSYQFNPDGTFTTSSLAGVSAGSYGARSKGSGGGTYKLSGNILELASGGKTTRHTAYPYQLSKGDMRLNIDGEMFKRER
jgi:hypothetical protein